jgi:hypothetical protein
MHTPVFETAVLASERSKTLAEDRAATTTAYQIIETFERSPYRVLFYGLILKGLRKQRKLLQNF